MINLNFAKVKKQNSIIKMTARCRKIYTEDYAIQTSIEDLAGHYGNNATFDYKHNSLIIHYKKWVFFNEIEVFHRSELVEEN